MHFLPRSEIRFNKIFFWKKGNLKNLATQKSFLNESIPKWNEFKLVSIALLFNRVLNQSFDFKLSLTDFTDLSIINKVTKS